MSDPGSFASSRYVLLNLIGSGGMGEVFRAYDRLTHSHVALKRLRIHITHDPITTGNLTSDVILDTRYTLAREFTTLAGLRHRHIIDVRDFGFAAGQPFYTMSMLDNAHTLIEEAVSAQSLPEIVRMLGEVLLALAYLHQRGIVHRDIKPQNVLVSGDGTVRLTDFGLAIEAVQAREARGTLLYTAPELLSGEYRAGPATDLYAVGVMAFEAFSGTHPFGYPSSSVSDLIDAILDGDARFELLDVTLLDWPLGPDQRKALMAFVRKLMHIRPAERYSHAGEALRALYESVNLPLPSESADQRESFLQAARFVGRETELSKLKAGLATALNGHGSGWLVGGESGVGKSRLMNELRTRALVNGYLVLTGQAVEGGGLPYQLWRSVLPPLALELDLTDLEASVLKPVVPDLESLIGQPVSDVPDLPGEAGRQRFALTLVALLRRLNRPVLIILEDLHWQEDSEILADLIRALPDLPLLVVGTYRDDEAPDLPGKLPEMTVIHLARLTESEIARLSQSMIGEAGQRPDVIGALWQETEGNAFFLVEVLRALAEESGGLANIGLQTLPVGILTGGVQLIVARRLARMPDWGQRLLRLAALIGRQIDVSALEHAIRQDDFLPIGRTLGDWLESAAGAALLIPTAERWEFAHDKLREYLTRDIDAAERVIMYRTAALALEVAHPNDPGYNEVLLAHWREARDISREINYLLPVVENMIVSHESTAAHLQAERLISRGINLLPEDDVRRATLLNWYADIGCRRADYATARAHAEAARDLAERLGAPVEVARSLNLLGHIASDRGDSSSAEAYYQAGLAVRRALGDPEGISEALNGLSTLAMNHGDYVTAKAYLEESLSICRTLGASRTISGCLNLLGNIALDQGDLAAAESYYQESLSIRRSIGSMLGMAIILNNLGLVAHNRGDYLTADEQYRESLAISRSIGDTRGIVFTMANLSRLAFEQGQSSLVEYLREGLTTSLSIGTVPQTLELLVTVARYELRCGDTSETARTAGLVDSHPELSQDVRDEGLAKLLDELRAAVPADELAARRAEGARLQVEAVARHWLVRLELE